MKFSRLILGTVQFGLNYGINNRTGQPSLDSVMEILRVAADGGINVLDTARNYGDSEEVLGTALSKTGLAKHFKIISKVKLFPDGILPEAVPAWIEGSVTTSLKLLKQDCLEGLLLHHEKDRAFYPALDLCLRRGWAKSVGASLDSLAGSPQAFTDQLNMVQLPGNILDRRFFDVAESIHRRGGAVFMRSVYMQGLLFKPAAEVHPGLKSIVEIRSQLERVAGDAELTPAELYFRYLLSRPEIDSVLTGVDTPAQLRENIALAARGALPEDLLLAIEKVVPVLPEKLVRPSAWPR